MGTEGCQTGAGLWFDCDEDKMQSRIQALQLHGLEKFRAVGPYPARRGWWLHVGLLLPTPPGGASASSHSLLSAERTGRDLPKALQGGQLCFTELIWCQEGCGESLMFFS